MPTADDPDGAAATGGAVAAGGSTTATTTGGSSSTGGNRATGGANAGSGGTAEDGAASSGGSAPDAGIGAGGAGATGGDSATGGTTDDGGNAATGGPSATGGATSTGGAADACSPPTVLGPTSAVEYCGDTCGHTNNCTTFGNCGKTARDVTTYTDWAVVLPAEPDHFSSGAACAALPCDTPLYATQQMPIYRFRVGAGKCARFTTSDPTHRGFTEDNFSPVRACSEDSCLVVNGAEDVLVVAQLGTSVIAAPEAWVRAEVASSTGSCPFSCN